MRGKFLFFVLLLLIPLSFAFYVNPSDYKGVDDVSLNKALKILSDLAKAKAKTGISTDVNVGIDFNNSNFLNNYPGSYYLNRANHTGTQTASTISDFVSSVRNSISGNAPINYNSGTGEIGFNTLSCATGQAIQTISGTATCVDLNSVIIPDTNAFTAGIQNPDNNAFLIDVNAWDKNGYFYKSFIGATQGMITAEGGDWNLMVQGATAFLNEFGGVGNTSSNIYFLTNVTDAINATGRVSFGSVLGDFPFNLSMGFSGDFPFQFNSGNVSYADGVSYGKDANFIQGLTLGATGNLGFPSINWQSDYASISRLMWNRTGNRDINLPDASGTLALLSDFANYYTKAQTDFNFTKYITIAQADVNYAPKATTYTMAQVDANLAKYLPLSGGTMTGDINSNKNNVFDINSITVKNANGNFSTIDNNGSCLRLTSGTTLVFVGC